MSERTSWAISTFCGYIMASVASWWIGWDNEGQLSEAVLVALIILLAVRYMPND
jgi:hypothetical protein